ncbi:hypothetical protein DFJ73DRAFT_762470 [Zopfochytrium polystomum]|nr:hypothetical protein DFJ73DRAFT_762470 [Zopfochytrium polystomum]
MSRENSPQRPNSKRRREESFHQIDNYADDTRDYRDHATGHDITNHHSWSMGNRLPAQPLQLSRPLPSPALSLSVESLTHSKGGSSVTFPSHHLYAIFEGKRETVLLVTALAGHQVSFKRQLNRVILDLTFSRNGEDKDWLVEGHDELKDIILDGVRALHRKFTITVYLPKPVVDEVRMFDAKGGLGKVFVSRHFEEDEKIFFFFST